MAKAKSSNEELDRKLKAFEELVEDIDSTIRRVQDLPSLEKDDTAEIKKHLTSLKAVKEGLGNDVPGEIKKRIDQTVERLRNISQEKQKTMTVLDADKRRTLEALHDTIKNINAKITEFKSQLDNGQFKNKGKNQSKVEKMKKSIENMNYHLSRLEVVRSSYDSEPTTEKDQTLKEINTYFQEYLENGGYSQKQVSYLDGMYELFEKREDAKSETSLHNEEAEDATMKQVGSGAESSKDLSDNKDKQSEANAQSEEKASEPREQNPFMKKVRENNFEHEVRKMPIISEKDLKAEYNYFDVFEASARNIPQETDYYPNPIMKEKITTKTIYPKRKLVDEHMFERFDVDTLFFIFYFQKDTYEQYLAAKELKRRTWRFHKKYLTWFKRLEAPRVTNDEYEQGTYAFFDFEPGGWCQKRKSDFTFKYSYLEDEKL